MMADVRLMPAVARAMESRATVPTLNYLEVGYLKDLAEGREYSMRYSPHSVRKILRALIDCKVAIIPYQEIDGVVVDLVEITDYGRETLK